MKIRLSLILSALVAALAVNSAPASALTFELNVPKALSAEKLDGRAMVLLSTDPSAEPRFQVNFTQTSQILIATTADQIAPGQAIRIGKTADAWPVDSIAALKPGDYFVQGLIHKYETFKLADGRVLKLPPDRGEGQHWNQAPGNFYSKPVKIHIDPAKNDTIRITLDQQIAPIAPKPDSTYVRHVEIKSELLSAFWGRPVMLKAHILVPEGFDSHPQAHYPLMVFHGHFSDSFSDFRTDPPDENLKPDYSTRFHISGYNRIQQEESYKNYQQWIAPNFPRFLVVEIEHANPYYDDSYAVNSANLGPYGDAINRELIPAIEAKFRGIGQGWARFTYGGSTGGWEAMATQVFYPDDYNGAFAACPDPISFKAFTLINLYEDKNAYSLTGPHHSVERPAFRNYMGEITSTQRDTARYESALGDHGRSGEQYDIWQAVYGPIGPDGYPKPIWDRKTGEIDPNVAGYWKEHFDLVDIVTRNWSTLGPKLTGKINLYVGSADNYYLNDAVYIAQDAFAGLKNPEFGGEIAYGDRAEHCWNGDPAKPNYITRLHYNTMYLDKILARIAKTAPAGSDLTSWRY